MTTAASNTAICRQQWIKKQQATQINLLWCKAIPYRRQTGLQSANALTVW